MLNNKKKDVWLFATTSEGAPGKISRILVFGKKSSFVGGVVFVFDLTVQQG